MYQWAWERENQLTVTPFAARSIARPISSSCHENGPSKTLRAEQHDIKRHRLLRRYFVCRSLAPSIRALNWQRLSRRNYATSINGLRSERHCMSHICIRLASRQRWTPFVDSTMTQRYVRGVWIIDPRAVVGDVKGETEWRRLTCFSI